MRIANLQIIGIAVLFLITAYCSIKGSVEVDLKRTLKTETSELVVPWKTGGQIEPVDIINYIPFNSPVYSKKDSTIIFESDDKMMFYKMFCGGCSIELNGEVFKDDFGYIYTFKISFPDCFAKCENVTIKYAY